MMPRKWLQAVGIAGLALALVALIGAFQGVRLYRFGHLQSSTNAMVQINIPKGQNMRQIGRRLMSAGLITDADDFYWYWRLYQNKGVLIRAGFYEFEPHLSPSQIIDILQKGRVATLQITIPEGANAKEIAQLIAKSGLASAEAMLSAMQDPALIEAMGAPKIGMEGYLFPDTYKFDKGTPPKKILERMRARLDAVLSPTDRAQMQARGLTLHQVLTLASLVEKETGQAFERPMIAGVFFNRLKRKMRLQTDPTVIYAMPNYTGNITKKDLSIDSPYNTYRYEGLPPGPIASAGLYAIRAVLWPTQSDDLYFVSKNDGTHVFCPTLKCHNQAVKTWQVDYFRKKSKLAG